MIKENNFIDDPLLLNSTELAYLILELGLYEALKETSQFKYLIKYFLNVSYF